MIVGYNLGAEKVFGSTREEALGQDLSILIPTPPKKVHQEYVRRFLATREARMIGKHMRLKALRRGGRAFPLSISFSGTATREMAERLLHSHQPWRR